MQKNYLLFIKLFYLIYYSVNVLIFKLIDHQHIMIIIFALF